MLYICEYRYTYIYICMYVYIYIYIIHHSVIFIKIIIHFLKNTFIKFTKFQNNLKIILSKFLNY